MMSGSFTYGTFHLTGLTHLTSCLSPTVLAGRLPRPTPSPDFWSRGFHRASGTIRPSDDSQDTASHFARAYRVASLGATRGSWEPSWGHAQIFRTVPSANTLVRWVNENAFAPVVRARPCPTFGRPVRPCVRPWGSPHRLRPGTSPHTLRIPPHDGHPVLRSTSSGGFRSVLLVSSFRLRALRDLSIPSSRFGQRGITPTFGYGAPHPSAGGTSTLLIWALPGARRVGGGALDCSRAGLRPPLKLDVRFSRIQLSRRRSHLSDNEGEHRGKVVVPALAVRLRTPLPEERVSLHCLPSRQATQRVSSTVDVRVFH